MTTYKDSGVDIEAGYKSVELIKQHVKKTFRPEVITDIGGFGALFSINKDKYKKPVLVSGTDGVGTKLKIAFMMDKHDTIGQDCVAMCVNDVVCSGAEPLFFLDYLAVGKNIPDKIEKIVNGVANGCLESGCSLIGGETAEMPGMYNKDEYDIAGFCVGIVDKDEIIDGKRIKDGDVLVGLASSGLHSNGYSLVRGILNPSKDRLTEYIEKLGCTLGEELLRPTRIYAKTIMNALKKYSINGIANITGGGFYENIPRIVPQGLRVKIKRDSWPILPIFNLLQKLGKVDELEMYNTFNMGIGMVLIIDKMMAESLITFAESMGEKAYVIGEVFSGEAGVEFC